MSTLRRSISRRRILDESTDCLDIAPPVNKKLVFGLEDEEEDGQLQELNQFDLDLDSATDLSMKFDDDDKFSPCRTRSGAVYTSGSKRKAFCSSSSEKSQVKRASMRTRHASSRSHKSETGSMADCSGNESDERMSENEQMLSNLTEEEELEKEKESVYFEPYPAPPPLTYQKNPVSRLRTSSRPVPFEFRLELPSSPLHGCAQDDPFSSPFKTRPISKYDLGSSPIQSHSPPTNTLKAMRLGELMASPNFKALDFSNLESPTSACAVSHPRTTPRVLKSRLLFTAEGEPRRSSYPGPGAAHLRHRKNLMECDSTNTIEKAKLANINPFTPTALMAATIKRKRNLSTNDKSFSPSTGRELQKSLDNLSDPGSEEEEGRFSPLPNKRVRVSDINITRYQEEFLELDEIAAGAFGLVKKARHRLDGMVYAIKISKTRLRVNSNAEAVAMNEIFAHAALMKHKNVVRYFNSWVEKGQVYIQNEYCEGGSLQRLIEEKRRTRQRFPESELKRILVQVAKGLHYIHSNQLVHLDIKPGNILLSVDHTPTPSPNNNRINDLEFEDSGAASGDLSPRLPKMELSSGESSPGDGDKVTYKIGDLGHVVPVEDGNFSAEEGDCRYMAPEFLQMEVDRSKLPKSDIYSLGMTIYEAASLLVLPKNSDDCSANAHDYNDLKAGKLRYLKEYSKEFNSLLAKLVHRDSTQRPTAYRLLVNCDLNPGMSKTKYQLSKELKETKEKLMLLEAQLSAAKENTKRTTVKRKLVGRGAEKAESFHHL